MKNKKLCLATILAAMITAFSACSIPVSLPEIKEETASLSENSSESLPESESEPENEPEKENDPEPEEVSPAYTVTLSSEEVLPGSFITLRVENADLYDTTFTDFLGYEREFLGRDGEWFCFIPVKTAAAPGEYELSFNIGEETFSQKVTVLERTFNNQYLTVAPSTLEETLENEAVRAAFDVFYQEYRWRRTASALWDGEFILPLGEVKYRETTPFGTFRTFSNGSTEWHNATDMAAAGGTPVYATNSGRIIFSDYLGLTGHTILIDHGYGILSWHYHLSERNAAVGEKVEKGRLIGKVGTTGLSTGNHLHFAISVGGIFVDPMEMMGVDPDYYFYGEETLSPEVNG